MLIVVADNVVRQIEPYDQTVTHRKMVGTRLQVADNAGMARSFGMHTERVKTEDQLSRAIERALAKRPALLDMVVTPGAISSDGKSGLAWMHDLHLLPGTRQNGRGEHLAASCLFELILRSIDGDIW